MSFLPNQRPGINLGAPSLQVGRGGRFPQMPMPGMPQQQPAQAEGPPSNARMGGIADALANPVTVESGQWGEALAEALALGLRGRSARRDREREEFASDEERQQEQRRRQALGDALQGFDPNNPQAVLPALSQGAPDEALGLATALMGRDAPERWTDPYDLGGAQVQRNEGTNQVRPVMPAPQGGATFSILTPQQVQSLGLGAGSYQQNTRTGEVEPINTQRGSPLERAQAGADVERVNTFRAAADQDRQTAAQLQRFVQLNQREPGTGPGSMGSVDIMGITPFRNSESQQMAAIAADLTPEQREAGSGATSDFDARMFMAALPGLDKTPEANRAIAQAYGVRAELYTQRAQVAEAWLESGSLNGFDGAWSRYVAANPIFDPRSDPSNPRINPGRQDFITWAQANGVTLGARASEQLQQSQPRRRRWENGRLVDAN